MAFFLKNKKQQNVPRRRQYVREQTSRMAESPKDDQAATFRRNRTLTGSISSHVIATGEASAQLKSPRVQAHDLIRQQRHIGSILFLVVISAAILYALIYQFTAGVVVHTKDLSVRLDPVYEQAIQSYFASQPLERFRFLTNIDSLTAYVQSKAPEVGAILPEGYVGFGVSEFNITMRQPIAGWAINGQQEYVDSSGTPFVRNYFAAPTVQIVDNSGVQVQTGQAVASDRFLGFVGLAVGLAKSAGYKVTQVIIPEGTTRQIELKIDGLNYLTKLSIDRPAGEQIEDMANAIRWFQSHKQSPQYIDVRVSGKAFYR